MLNISLFHSEVSTFKKQYSLFAVFSKQNTPITWTVFGDAVYTIYSFGPITGTYRFNRYAELTSQ